MPYLSAAVQMHHSSYDDELNTARVIVRAATDSPPDFFNVSQALFGFLSAFIGLLALVIGLLQLRRHRRHQALHTQDSVFELEANIPKVKRSPSPTSQS
jgi:hypothetical protein